MYKLFFFIKDKEHFKEGKLINKMTLITILLASFLKF